MTHAHVRQFPLAALMIVAVLLVMSNAALAEADGGGSGLNRTFERIHDQVPGFGGAWVEGDAAAGEEETLHLWLKEPDADTQQRVETLLVASLGDRFDQESVVVHDDGIPWGRLHDWFITVSESHLDTTADVGYIGIREQVNRIVIGLEDPERDGAAARELLDELGVPQDAVVIEQGGPTRLLPAAVPFWHNPLMVLVLLGLGVAAVAAFGSWRVIQHRRRYASSS